MNNKIIAIRVTLVFLLITSIFLLIDGIKAVDIINDYDPYYYGSYYSSIKAIAVVELVFAIFILLFGLIALIVSFASQSEKSPHNMLLFVILLAAIQKIVATFQAIGLVNEISPGADIGATPILMLVFLILAALLVVIAMICVANDSFKAAGGIGIVVALLFVVVMIISLATGENSEAMAIIYMVLFILSMIIFGIASGIAVAEGSYYRSVANYYHSAPKPVNSASTPTNVSGQSEMSATSSKENSNHEQKGDDPAEALKKLKQLFDTGIITEEEYQEKRKKYIEKL